MIYLIVLGLVVFLTFGYFLLMIVCPEWVGISGKDTKKAIESHRGDTTDPPNTETQQSEREDSTSPS